MNSSETEDVKALDDVDDVAVASIRLIDWFADVERVTVAFSGGVDSSVVLAAASRSQATDVVAVTAVSPAVPQWQRDMAATIAGEIGVAHQWMQTDEGDSADYVRNDSSRCFHCKSTLYAHLKPIAGINVATSGNRDRQRSVTVSGTNVDDLGDHRPGIQAGRDAGVQTPLADLGLGKATVRIIARQWGLSNWDLPASPCLASRIAYGVSVTPARLEMTERAEDWLRQYFSDVRVRLHENELARIEVPRTEMERFFDGCLVAETNRTLRNFGYQFVAIDAGGLQTGNLNRILDSDSLIQIDSPS